MKKTAYERFMAMSDAEKDAAVAKYDEQEISFEQTRPLSKESRRLHALAARRGRPKVGEGAKRVMLSIERSTLDEMDQLAQRMGISRSELLVRGFRAVRAAVA